MSDLRLAITADNSRGLRDVADDPVAHQRTITLTIDRRSDGTGYQVTASGAPFPASAGRFCGTLPLSQYEIHGAIEEVRTAWVKNFLDYQDSDDIRKQRYPFNDRVDLREADNDAWQQAILRLARAGNTLFRILFYQGDEVLREIGERLTAATRQKPQTITIYSDDIVVPWSMLYIPPDPQPDLDSESAQWIARGFWGHRHLIEHGFTHTPKWTAALELIGRVRAGLNVDRNLDDQFRQSPTVQPIVDLFHAAADTTVRTMKTELATAIKAKDFADQVIYFGCHGSVSGDLGSGLAQAHLVLTDGEPIGTNNFRNWLEQTPFSCNPIVFVNACQGGQMRSMFFTSFGHVFLQYGANCLIGPQIDIPPAFATEYASRFFTRILEPGNCMGDVVLGLTREFFDQSANPLGLTYSLYRGLDTHFTQRQA